MPIPLLAALLGSGGAAGAGAAGVAGGLGAAAPAAASVLPSLGAMGASASAVPSILGMFGAGGGGGLGGASPLLSTMSGAGGGGAMGPMSSLFGSLTGGGGSSLPAMPGLNAGATLLAPPGGATPPAGGLSGLFGQGSPYGPSIGSSGQGPAKTSMMDMLKGRLQKGKEGAGKAAKGKKKTKPNPIASYALLPTSSGFGTDYASRMMAMDDLLARISA